MFVINFIQKVRIIAYVFRLDYNFWGCGFCNYRYVRWFFFSVYLQNFVIFFIWWFLSSWLMFWTCNHKRIGEPKNTSKLGIFSIKTRKVKVEYVKTFDRFIIVWLNLLTKYKNGIVSNNLLWTAINLKNYLCINIFLLFKSIVLPIKIILICNSCLIVYIIKVNFFIFFVVINGG